MRQTFSWDDKICILQKNRKHVQKDRNMYLGCVCVCAHTHICTYIIQTSIWERSHCFWRRGKWAVCAIFMINVDGIPNKNLSLGWTAELSIPGLTKGRELLDRILFKDFDKGPVMGFWRSSDLIRERPAPTATLPTVDNGPSLEELGPC